MLQHRPFYPQANLFPPLQTEFETITKIMPARQEDIFVNTSASPLSQLSRTFKALNTYVRSSPSQNMLLTLSILEDLAVAEDIIAQSTLPLETIESIKRETTGLEREAKGVGTVGVADVVEDIKRRGQSVLTLPSDAGIIDLTVDVPISTTPPFLLFSLSGSGPNV